MESDKKLQLRKMVSSFVFWSGLSVIGISAILAGVLFGIIFFIGKALDIILKKIDED